MSKENRAPQSVLLMQMCCHHFSEGYGRSVASYQGTLTNMPSTKHFVSHIVSQNFKVLLYNLRNDKP